MSGKNYDIYVSGGGSHVLCALFPEFGKIGQRTFSEVFVKLLGVPFGTQLVHNKIGLDNIKEMPPVDFLNLLTIRDLKSEDQIRRWMFLQQLIWIRLTIRTIYNPKNDGQIRVKWNRNKTLVSTVNLTARESSAEFFREEDELVLDFGGGQIKSPYSTENHDASSLLEVLRSGDSEQIHQSTLRLSALVGKLMSEAAKTGHKGFSVRCLCTGKYWKEIIDDHSDKFLNNTFKMEWIDSEQERGLEFGGCVEAFASYAPDADPTSIYVGNITSGGSSSEIWFMDRVDSPRIEDVIFKIPIPHGSKSSIFWNKEKTASSLPTSPEMMQIFQDCLLPWEGIAEDPIDEETISRTVSGAPW
jgi:hypothetical protein